MNSTVWDMTGALLAVLAPLVGVPLTVIVFYLRSLREQQLARFAELSHRCEAMESASRQAAEVLTRIQREYTTKEEWLRESMWSRDRIERLTATLARLEIACDQLDSLRTSTEQTLRLVARITKELGVPPEAR